MELPDLLAALRKRWFVLVVLALVGALYGYTQVSRAQPVYRSTSKVFVSLTQGNTVAELVQGSTYTQNLVTSFAQLATMPIVLEPVIEQLDLDATAKSLADRVQADAVMDAVIIEISASSPKADAAADIANAVATQLSQTVKQVTPATEDGGPSVNMTVVSRAEPARAPYGPNKKLVVGTPAVAGLALGFAIALLWSRLDTRVRSPKDFPGPVERPVLGQIMYDKRLRLKGARTIHAFPHGAVAESFRRLRTNLQYVNTSAHYRTIVVTSSIPGEGKSTTALNLAITLAERRMHVLLVDADMRRPSIARMTDLEGAVGLSTVLVGEASIENVVQPWGSEDLHIVPAGGVPPNPSQLIDSDAMTRFLATARELYDVIIIDTPPMLALADAAILAKKADGAIVVAGARKVRRAQLAETLGSLDAIEATVIGMVANGMRGSSQDSLYGYGLPVERNPLRRWSRRLRTRSASKARAGAPPTIPGRLLPEDVPHQGRFFRLASMTLAKSRTDAGGDN